MEDNISKMLRTFGIILIIIAIVCEGDCFMKNNYLVDAYIIYTSIISFFVVCIGVVFIKNA